MTFSALRGLGDCYPTGTDEYGELCAYVPPAPSAGTVYSSTTTTPQGNGSTGFNWGGFLSSITPTLANDATRIGQQAIATPGTSISPGGSVVVGGGMQSGVSSNAAQSITAMMPVILLGVGGLLLIMVMKRH